MRYCIALNGAFFNTQRMVMQYVGNAYLRSVLAQPTVSPINGVLAAPEK